MRWRAPWWILTSTFLSASAKLAAQQQPAGSLRGQVLDKDFDTPLGGAEVLIVETRQKTLTNDQGSFVLGQVAPGRYTVVIAKDGYVRQVRSEVTVEAGRLTDLTVSLVGDFTELDELVVQDLLQLGMGTEAGLLQLRLDSASLMDSIGVEMMSRAGASNAADGLRLVAGASLQDGKSAVIRGLPDRYVSSQMNGMRLPTADENKRAVELDQFPAPVIESIQVSKTFTPDQQGDASGGAVNLRLKGVPDEPFFLRFRAQASYNPQVNGRKDFLTYPGGGVNFLGEDDGGRGVQWGNVGGNWTGAVGVTRGEAPALDGKWSVSGGGSDELSRGVKIGGFVSLFHERTNAFYEDGRDDSYWVESPGAPMTPRTFQGTRFDPNFRTALFDVTQGRQTVKWGSLATFGIRSENHSVNLNYLYTKTAEDTATLAEDTRGKQYFFPGHNPDDPTTPGHSQRLAAPYLRLETLAYNERTTDTLQLHGRHAVALESGAEGLLPELEWTIARSSADLNEPDKRQFGSAWLPDRANSSAVHIPYKPDATFSLGNLQRTFKEIEEETDSYAWSLKLPFEQWTRDQGYVKFGAFHEDLTRSFHQESFSNFNDNTAFRGPFHRFWSGVFPSENHPITESLYDVDYRGTQRIGAGYAMLDLPITSFASVLGGVRFESTDLAIINFPEPLATWFPPGATGPTLLRPGDADVRFEQNDFLPSLGLEIKPAAGVVLRAAYNETVARQTFKELSPIIQQEYLGGPIFIGNPQLLMSALRNYDLRADYTPYEGGLFSVSWFRKDIKRPIEYTQRITTFDFTTAVNYPRGELSGWEFETRQGLGRFWDVLDGLSIGANATFIDSQVNLPPDEIAKFNQPGIQAPMSTRDMTNAPEHLYNLYATYDIAATGTQAGIFYTVQGDTLVAGAGTTIDKFVPSVYALEYDTLNVTISQLIGKHVRLQLGAKNLTNPMIQEAYRSPYIGADVTRTSYTRGIEYTISLAWEVRL